MTAHLQGRSRWLALIILCLGDLMIVLDSTVVNVALPSIRGDLGFTETSLVWVVNAYLLTYGGFLLLGGRLGDLYGHRRLFLIGIVFFTLASLACGLATTQTLLIAARAIQGLASGVVNTSFMMGGAIGLAILASLSAAETAAALAGGAAMPAALNEGYQLAFLLRQPPSSAEPAGAPAPAEAE